MSARSCTLATRAVVEKEPPAARPEQVSQAAPSPLCFRLATRIGARNAASAGSGGPNEASAGARTAAGSSSRSRWIALAPAPGWPKLAINTPGDAYEREAERVADLVTSGAAAGGALRGGGRVLRRCACGGTCAACRGEEAADELQRMESGGAAPSPRFAPPIVHDVLASPGRPLEAGVRTRMEERIGAGFGAVRVHDDGRAGESARVVDAHAYTVGSHVAFAAGRYAPGTREGDRLIAHELVHVVQQEAGAPTAVRRQSFLGDGMSTSDPMDDPRMHPQGAPGAVSCAPPAGCPPGFCQPYSSASYATHQRTRLLPTLLLGIAAFVNTRVLPLWHAYLLGGSAPPEPHRVVRPRLHRLQYDRSYDPLPARRNGVQPAVVATGHPRRGQLAFRGLLHPAGNRARRDRRPCQLRPDELQHPG